MRRETLAVSGVDRIGPYSLVRVRRGSLESGVPGQFFMLSPPGRLLPRPMSLCLATRKEIGFLIDPIGPGTRALAELVRNQRVAVLGGSGGSFISEAADSGAHAYVTGDVDYHDPLLAESLGLIVIDAGHAATELPSLQPLAARLAGHIDVPVAVSRVRR